MDMGMGMASEVSAEGLVSTQLDLFMSLDLPKDLASAVLSPAILVMDLLPMAMLSVLSALELVSIQLGQSMSPDQRRVSVVDTCTRLLLLLLCNVQYTTRNIYLLNL